MNATEFLCHFAAALETLLRAPDATRFEAAWKDEEIQPLGWGALARARQAKGVGLAPALAEVDAKLLAALERCHALLDPHIATFRVPELERWQHAAAAALVNARWGVAGLRTVIADAGAPLARRYFAFVTLAERHPPRAWPLFEQYLATPHAHHAFVAAAVEAARFYGDRAARTLLQLFARVRADPMLRRFLGPKILASLYALNSATALPLYRELLVAGHTDPDPHRCEVTRALVAIRRLIGRVAESVKFPDASLPEVSRVLDDAERVFQHDQGSIHQVAVI